MTKIQVNGKSYEDFTDKIIRCYLVDDLSFTPKDGDSAGKPIIYKRLAIDIQVGSNTRQVLLKPQQTAEYEFLAMAETQE